MATPARGLAIRHPKTRPGRRITISGPSDRARAASACRARSASVFELA